MFVFCACVRACVRACEQLACYRERQKSDNFSPNLRRMMNREVIARAKRDGKWRAS